MNCFRLFRGNEKKTYVHVTLATAHSTAQVVSCNSSPLQQTVRSTLWYELRGFSPQANYFADKRRSLGRSDTLWYWETKSVIQVQRRYRREYGEQAAGRQSIKRSPKLNVCCALSRREVMGPIFFQGHEQYK
jgi:hypothetical protein